jgi:3-dehydroquinate synthase
MRKTVSATEFSPKSAGGLKQRIMQRISVDFDYPVYFTSDLFSIRNPVFRAAVTRKEPDRRHRLLVVIDSGVAACWPLLADNIRRYVAKHDRRLELVADPFVVKGGESCKNDRAAASELHRLFNLHRMDRQSLVVVVGGGAVLDMAGYAAAIAHRGLRVLRVPTTVLAQDDSGVSVKNGINAFGKKNFLGAFAPPFAVLNDRRFLETLTPRDRIAGTAEAVKVALIRDGGFFAWLVDHKDALAAGKQEDLWYLIRRSAQLHAEHIAFSGDPFEMSSARPLDFGHWVAHKLESLSRHDLRHGEAVALGMALDSFYSAQVGLLSNALVEPIVTLLEGLGFRLWHESLDRRDPAGHFLIWDGLQEFREHLGGEFSVTLPKKIGEGVEVHTMRKDAVLRSIEWLRERSISRNRSS